MSRLYFEIMKMSDQKLLDVFSFFDDDDQNSEI